MPGFEGTTRFTNPTLSRFELSRPFPAFTGASTHETERNDGKMTYDSLQFVANKRWARASPSTPTTPGCRAGPRRREHDNGIGNAFIDDVSSQKNDGPYFSHRKHRITASGVWEMPWLRNRPQLARLRCSAAGRLRRCSSSSRASRGTCRATSTSRRASIRTDVALHGKKDGQFIYGVKPCVGQRNATTGNYDLLSVSQAYGCTEPYFLIREAFQRRTAKFRYDEFRRPGFWQVDVNFAKTTPITDKVRFQVRIEAFNIFNSPMYDEREYDADTASCGLRPHQPEHHAASPTSSGSSSWDSS